MTATSKPGPAEAITPVPTDRPDRMCDVVMKGGIASGVVYPNAITEIARSYRLKSVGGTSAGAIAAAVAAAAEYGRKGGGYEQLAALPGTLSVKGKLKSLFQAQWRTRGLYGLMLAAARRPFPVKLLALLYAAIVGFPLGTLAGAVPGAWLLSEALDDDPQQITWIVVSVVVLLAGALVGVLGAIAFHAARSLPRNRYGTCSGMDGHRWRLATIGSALCRRESPEALTPWLTGLIDHAAGLTDDPDAPSKERGPLTFGQLWDGPADAAQDGADRPSGPSDRRWLTLEMMTTNLTNHRAERLPMSSREYWFDPDELRGLFPRHVIDHMIACPPALPEGEAASEASELRRTLLEPLKPMPDPKDLPVVVATRMSLSFPILLSAVPLWRIDYTLERNQKPLTRDHPPFAERCWFSDGGISSNFPVQFFDSYLPRHPTFAINLRPPRPDDVTDDGRETRDPCHPWVEMPTSNGDELSDWWYRLQGWHPVTGFVANIVRTMQNRVDDAQMRVPGYRDRIAHVSLAKDQGGMNLDMDASVVTTLTLRGKEAGKMLVQRFSSPPEAQTMSWDNHRWIRFRTTITATAEAVRELAEQYHDRAPAAGERTYAELLDRTTTEPPSSSRLDNDDQRTATRALLEGLAQTIQDMDAPPGSRADVARGSPRPQPTLRMSPHDAAAVPVANPDDDREATA